jgi:hypothetical protein
MLTKNKIGLWRRNKINTSVKATYPTAVVAVLALGFMCSHCLADHLPVNWQGNFAPCERRSEVLKRDAMNLGVRISTSNWELATQFKNALSFWAKIIDMTWHQDQTSSCSVALVEGTPAILKSPIVARSQFAESAIIFRGGSPLIPMHRSHACKCTLYPFTRSATSWVLGTTRTLTR